MDQLNLLSLKRRMGWTTSDLARRLGVTSTEIQILETNGDTTANRDLLNRIEFLFRQAEMCCEEVKQVPLAESTLEATHLGQIENSALSESRKN